MSCLLNRQHRTALHDFITSSSVNNPVYLFILLQLCSCLLISCGAADILQVRAKPKTCAIHLLHKTSSTYCGFLISLLASVSTDQQIFLCSWKEFLPNHAKEGIITRSDTNHAWWKNGLGTAFDKLEQKLQIYSNWNETKQNWKILCSYLFKHTVIIVLLCQLLCKHRVPVYSKCLRIFLGLGDPRSRVDRIVTLCMKHVWYFQ